MRRFIWITEGSVKQGGEELLNQWQNSKQGWIWLDLYDEEAKAEEAFLRKNFALDEFEIIEAQRLRHPPSIAFHNNYTYLLTKPLDSDSHDLDFSTLQLALFMGDNFLVTRRGKKSNYLDQLWSNIVENKNISLKPSEILSALLRRITTRYANILLNLESRLDVIEDEIFASSSEDLVKELSGYNTSLRKMRRIIAYHNNIFEELTQKIDHTIYSSWHDDIADIASLMQRNNSLADLYQNVITDLIDAYISLNGHHLNQIMKVLTIVTVIFVPITFLAGIYGMNFENIPELKSSGGYYILLSVMFVITTLLLIIFRKKHWL
jgi:magnesium transporter